MDYFDSFINECIRDLKKDKETFVFTEEQVEALKKAYPNIIVTNVNQGEYFKIKLSNKKLCEC